MRAKGMTMLEVACRRCERRGRLSIARLIAEHGSGVLDLRAIIAADCPRMQNHAEQGRLDVRALRRAFPGAAALVSEHRRGRKRRSGISCDPLQNCAK